jgi:hypothetical protein
MRAAQVFITFALFGVVAVCSGGKAQEHPPSAQSPRESAAGTSLHRGAKPEQSQTAEHSYTAPARDSASQQQNPQPHVLVKVEHESDRTDNLSVSGWFRFILGLLLPWPALVIAVLLYLILPTRAPSRIEALLKPFGSFTLFGQQFVLNSQSGRNAEDAIGFYRREVQEKLDRQVKKLSLVAAHKVLVKKYISILVPNFASLQIRSTIHIPDLLFAETLYQLLDYDPAEPGPWRGRTFSTRFGIIGKAWRLKESQYASEVPTAERDLVLGWGMTQEEAQKAGQGKQSFGCVILQGAAGNPLAVFYLDSPIKAAFGDSDMWERLRTAILKGAKETNLITSLESINKDLLSASPRVRIYSSAHMGSI